MPFASLARLFCFGSCRRRRQQRRSVGRVHDVTTVKRVVRVSDMEPVPVEFDMCSNRSMPYPRSGARTVRFGSMKSMRSFRAVTAAGSSLDPVKEDDQKKLRKAKKRAVKQERRHVRKMRRLARRDEKRTVNRGSRSRTASLSAESVSSMTSDQDILAEIWAKRAPSLDYVSDEDLPEVDDDLAPTAPMEFLFFTGCSDGKHSLC